MSTLAVRLGDLITAIGTDYKAIKTMITGTPGGNLTGLTTTDKTTVVAAINEVNAKPAATAASTTAAGISELATDAEALAMTDTARVLTASNLAGIVNVNNGLVKLDAGGKVAAAQLPAYVDDVLEVANFAALPGTGVAGLIYVTIDTNKTYRWTGTVYVEISASPGTPDAVTEGATNLYFTNGRADARVTLLTGNTDADLVALYTAAKV
jgi:hypothetical protein